MVGRPILRSEEKVGDVVLKVCQYSLRNICLPYLQDIMVGDECAKLRSMLEVNYPVSAGIVRNWDDMNHLWDYTFNEKLKIDPTDCRILLTEPPMNPKENRQNDSDHAREVSVRAAMLRCRLCDFHAQGMRIANMGFAVSPLPHRFDHRCCG